MAPSVKAVYWLADDGLPLSKIAGPKTKNLFTHVFCGFAKPDPKRNYNVVIPPNFPQTAEITELKKLPLKLILSIGGEGDLTTMAANKSHRATFIASSIKAAKSRKFDGIDLYYKYPANQTDVNNLAELLREWKAAIDNDPYVEGGATLLLTAAVHYTPTCPGSQTSYPLEAIAANLDWINVMAYDLHTPGTRSTPTPTAPAAALTGLGRSSTINRGGDGVNKWLTGVPEYKIVFGIPFGGYAWMLQDAAVNGYGAAGAGPAISHDGAVTYNQIKEHIASDSGPKKSIYSNPPVGNYWFSGKTWISYDDVDAVKDKVRFCVVQKDLLGYFGSSFAADDDDATLATAASSALTS